MVIVLLLCHLKLFCIRHSDSIRPRGSITHRVLNLDPQINMERPVSNLSPAQEYYRRMNVDKRTLEKMRFGIVLTLGTITLVACVIYIIYRCTRNLLIDPNEEHKEAERETEEGTRSRLLKRTSTTEVCTISNAEFYVWGFS